MTIPVGNVISFPEGIRASSAGGDRVGVLVEARDLMAGKLREAFASVLPEVEEELLTKGDVALGRVQRELFYDTRNAIHDQAGRLEGFLAARWSAFFQPNRKSALDMAKPASAVGDPDELQLVDFGTMDQELVVNAIAGRLRSACDDALFALDRRLAFLSGQPEGTLQVEHFIAQSLDGAFEDAGLAGPAKTEVLRAVLNRAVAVFRPTIDDLNAFLVARGVLPDLRRSYSPSSTKKKEAGEADRATDATDLFALLQKLVQAQPSGAVSSGGLGSVASGAGPGPGGGGGGGSVGGSWTGGGIASGMFASPGGVPAGVAQQGGTSSGNMLIAMDQVMATLDTLQRAVPVHSATPVAAGSVLREFRTSDTGQGLDQLNSVTVDIVATLFDFIFDDASVGDPIKALVARLQIPVLKVALLDKTFFSSKAHPARRLLDGISRAAIRCGPLAGHENPLYARITEIVERLQNEFTQDTGLFDTLCLELNTFLDAQEDAADARAAQAAPLVVEQERQELAVMTVDQALASWLAMPLLPSAVTDLLTHEWRMLLIRHYVDQDDNAWGAAMGTISDLVASIEPQPDAQSRKRLAARLPTLVRRICDGLASLEMADERRLALIDALFSMHAAVLRGAAPLLTKTQAPVTAAEPARIASEHIEHGETHLERISLADGSALAASQDDGDIRSLVGGLQRGDWVEFANAESGALRYRLSWISPQRGILLFTNSQSPRAISVAPDALTLQIERGEATIVPVEPMFDRAVNRALEKLKAA